METRTNPVDLLVGQRIAHFRRAAGIGSQELASRLGVPPHVLESIELGHHRAGPPLIAELATMLQRPVVSFFVDRRDVALPNPAAPSLQPTLH